MVAINAVMGTLIAWVLVRDHFRGKSVVNSLIDLPFALPTIVAGLTLLALYGPSSPLGVNLAFTKAGIVMALLLVSLPFVVRSVQPVLLELDREMEEAAASLGAEPPHHLPPHHLPEPAARRPRRHRPRVRPGARRVRRARPDRGQRALRHRVSLRSTSSSQIESDRPISAAAVSVALLVLSLAALLLLSALERWTARHAR